MSRADEPAYPVPGLKDDPDFNGLSVREYFAAQFLAAMLTHPTRSTDGLHECEIACQYADALLAELVKPASRAVVIAERRAAWEAITAHIKTGQLQGNGCDETAQRNGLILAANLLRERLDEVQP